MSWLVLLMSGSLMVLAAWHDLVARTIPNALCAALAVLGILARAGEGPLAVGLSAGAALTLFLLLLPVHAAGALGGGDVKLAAGVALGLPPIGVWHFVIATAMAGGVLALLYLALARLVPVLRPMPGGRFLRRVAAAEAWRIRRGGPLPYGVAIAAGGLLVTLALPGP